MKKKINRQIMLLLIMVFAGWALVTELVVHFVGHMESMPPRLLVWMRLSIITTTAAALVLVGILLIVYIRHTITDPLDLLENKLIAMEEGELPDRLDRYHALLPELDRIDTRLDRLAQQLKDQQAQIENQQELLTLEEERANLANAAKRTFLTRISHEIRTPMNGIMGMTTVAELHLGERERVMDALGKIDQSGRQLLEMLDELLDMSVLESGRLDLTEENFCLSNTIARAIDLLRPMALARQHHLVLAVNKISHDAVVGAPERVQAIFSNLVENSVKYTPKGGRIRVTVEELPSDLRSAGKYRFTFEDNGIGMSEEAKQHIFEPFERGWEDRRTEEIQGMGLGLPLVKNIVQLMNGTIEVNSEPESGTRIVVTIHLKLQKQAEKVAAQHMNSEVNIEEFRKENYCDKRVLLVEDNELSREIAEEILKLTGIQVDHAENGQQAVMRVAEMPENYYQLIFMDIQMPVMDGYIATRMIRGLDRKDVGTLPIVAMTALALDEDINEAKQAGMNDHIAKPLQLERLQEILLTWL